MAARKRPTPPTGYVIYDGPSLLTGDPIVCVATLHSDNRKTGDMIQTWILLQDRDPIAGSRSGADRAICGDCPSRGIAKPHAESGLAAERSCYVDLVRAPLGIWNAWRRGRYPAAVGHAAIAAIGRGRKVRLGAYGDPAAIPSYVNSSLISAAAGHTAYSHQIAWSGDTGFDAGRMMVSADSAAAAIQAWSEGARTFRVVGDMSEVIRGREILCPASEEAGKRTKCTDCLLCGGNAYHLDLNRTLQAPSENEPPWNLPSRMFQFPAETQIGADGKRHIGLCHPLLRDHPYVKRLEAEGFHVEPDGAPNAYGYSARGHAIWWHAVDLVSKGMWRELIETRRFTTDEAIARAVTYGLDYGGSKPPMLSVKDARVIMTRHLGIPEPKDRQSVLRQVMKPSVCKPDHGGEHWPINDWGADVKPTLGSCAWVRIIGIEAGWFAYRSRFLQWTETGRATWEAVKKGKRKEAVTTIEGKHGQMELVLCQRARQVDSDRGAWRRS